MTARVMTDGAGQVGSAQLLTGPQLTLCGNATTPPSEPMVAVLTGRRSTTTTTASPPRPGIIRPLGCTPPALLPGLLSLEQRSLGSHSLVSPSLVSPSLVGQSLL